MRPGGLAPPIAIAGDSRGDVEPHQSASTSNRLLFSQYS